MRPQCPPQSSGRRQDEKGSRNGTAWVWFRRGTADRNPPITHPLGIGILRQQGFQSPFLPTCTHKGPGVASCPGVPVAGAFVDTVSWSLCLLWLRPRLSDWPSGMGKGRRGLCHCESHRDSLSSGTMERKHRHTNKRVRRTSRGCNTQGDNESHFDPQAFKLYKGRGQCRSLPPGEGTDRVTWTRAARASGAGER